MDVKLNINAYRFYVVIKTSRKLPDLPPKAFAEAGKNCIESGWYNKSDAKDQVRELAELGVEARVYTMKYLKSYLVGIDPDINNNWADSQTMAKILFTPGNGNGVSIYGTVSGKISSSPALMHWHIPEILKFWNVPVILVDREANDDN